jgi:hypothetical protein
MRIRQIRVPIIPIGSNENFYREHSLSLHKTTLDETVF